MADVVLNLHSGGRLVTYDELKAVPVPDATATWHPVAHARVLDTVLETLTGAGYEVQDRQLALARHDARFFGTLTLATPLTRGTSLAVGIRSSLDRSFPLSFCAGNRCFVCSNLSFHSDLMVKMRHTRFGETRFQNAIAGAIQELGTFKAAEQVRIERMMTTEISEDQAYALILRAFEKAIISSLVVGRVLQEWKHPTHDYGTGDRSTIWKLANSFTTALRTKAVSRPSEYAGQTMRINALLAPAVTHETSPVAA